LRRSEPLPPARLNTTAAVPVVPASVQQTNVNVPVAATPSSTVATSPPQGLDRDPFAGVPKPTVDAPAPPSVFSTVSDGPQNLAVPSEPAAPAPRIHVVHEGDSLDRLAKRYLGDEARALEIFDLNRDLLDNPHVLRIGVELRIPGGGPAVED
jgi:nucleoid-associated protein YgaU